jgi:hypothetical protein
MNWSALSVRVGMPRGLSLPFDLEIYIRLQGAGAKHKKTGLIIIAGYQILNRKEGEKGPPQPKVRKVFLRLLFAPVSTC